MSEHTPSLSSAGRTCVVVGFALLCAAIFGFLWVNSGGDVPSTSSSYEVAFDVPQVGNLVYFSDVMVAGVKVGKVREVDPRGDHARVVMRLDKGIAPLHRGVKLQLGSKSLVEESYVEVLDGKGAPIQSGTTLPAGTAKPAVHLDDVLNSLDEPTRAHLRALVRSSGLASKDTRIAVEQAVIGLGDLGDNGHDVVDAVAAQSDDLGKLTRNATRVLGALNNQRARLRTLVADAQTVTEVTAGQKQDVEAFMESLPPLLDAARGSSGDLERLGHALTPVAQNLSAAAPDLTAALDELPDTTRELRATMPALDGVLQRAPATLTRTPQFGADLDAILPKADAVLADANPMLAYLSTYNRDLSGFFANFAQVLGMGDRNGKWLRILPVTNEQSFSGYPISTNIGPLDKYNPMPAAGSLNQPGPYRGTYPRVERRRP